MILGIDYGRAKVGLAVAEDEKSSFAIPLKIVRYATRGELTRAFKKVREEYAIESIIVGDPRCERGRGDDAESFLAFLNTVREAFGIEPTLVTEYLTTKEAVQLLREDGNDKKHDEDSLAAKLILETYLGQTPHDHSG